MTLKEINRKKLNKPSSRRERVTLNITLMKGKFPNVFFAIFFLSLYIFYVTSSGAITRATTEINFSRMFSDGPEVSLKGSPTVSPTTAAL